MCPTPSAARPGRRAVLVGLVTGLTLTVSGCGVDLGDLRGVRLDDDEPFPEPSPGPDELARRRAVTDADDLRRAVTAAVASRPELAALLTAVAQAHSDQLDALGAADLAVETPTPVPEPTGTGTGAPAPPAAEVLPGAQTTAAVAALADLAAVSGGMARLLASVAAADVVHARQLARALGQEDPEVPAAVTPGTEPGHAEVTLDADATAALTAALEGEYAAVFGYGVVAARLVGDSQEQARAHLEEHRRAAATLADLLRSAGHPVPVAQPGYELPGPAASPDELRNLALLLEERTSGQHAAVVAAADDGVRLVGADLLVAAALRAAAWRGAGVPLPGLA